MSKFVQPTAAELKILRALWRNGPSTVRTVYEDLDTSERLAYTTVLKQLQIMTDKGLVERDTRDRAHVYRPTHSQDQTERNMLGDFMSRVYDGCSSRLVVQALGMSEPASPAELEEIRMLVRTLRDKRHQESS
jgi:predicted transcriptional regulator